MKVVTPIKTTTANLTSSTILEPDSGETEWTAGTYALGTIRIESSTHRKYQVVADPNTTDRPSVGVLATPATWVDIGATNRFAMFDDINSTQSVDNQNLTVQITPDGLVSSVSGFNISGASSITVTLTDPTEGLVYTRSIDMVDNDAVADWYFYYFSEIIVTSRFILLDLPAYPQALLEVAILGDAEIKIGTLVYGKQITLGVALYGTSYQALDFSIKERDAFGNFKIVKRNTSDLLDYDCYLPKDKFGYVKNQLKALTTVPTVWVGDENDINDGTAVFGYYKDSQINITGPQVIDMTIQVEGLI